MSRAARALAEAADSLRAAAAVHKRSAAAHRRALRQTLDRLHAVERDLEAMGIPKGTMAVEITTEIKGDPSDDGTDEHTG